MARLLSLFSGVALLEPGTEGTWQYNGEKGPKRQKAIYPGTWRHVDVFIFIFYFSFCFVFRSSFRRQVLFMYVIVMFSSHSTLYVSQNEIQWQLIVHQSEGPWQCRCSEVLNVVHGPEFAWTYYCRVRECIFPWLYLVQSNVSAYILHPTHSEILHPLEICQYVSQTRCDPFVFQRFKNCGSFLTAVY